MAPEDTTKKENISTVLEVLQATLTNLFWVQITSTNTLQLEAYTNLNHLIPRDY